MTEAITTDVAIIGGGPSGIAAALELSKRGISVLLLEREAVLGGIPRHCAHSPFGMREFGRVYFGPAYARRLAREVEASAIDLRLSHSVTALRPGGALEATSPAGRIQIKAKRVILATGVREMPRSQRLVSGTRPYGVMTTGSLQHSTVIEGQKPVERPVIIGTELVSFSALLTCQTAKIKPVAMIESAPHITARAPFTLWPRLKGIPVLTGTKLLEIQGVTQVEAVMLQHEDGRKSRLDCDGVIFTGRFTPEASLARMSHLVIDPATQGPEVDQFARCSDPHYFACGNVLHPVETAGWCFREGRKIASFVADDLRHTGGLAAPRRKIDLCPDDAYVLPQVLTEVLPQPQSKGLDHLQMRVKRRGRLSLQQDGVEIWQSGRVSPQRRILAPMPKSTGQLSLHFIAEDK